MFKSRPWYSRLVLPISLILVVAFAGGNLWAQTGVLNGFVTDPAGAFVPQATVTATSEEMGTVSSTKTTSTGFFRIPALNSGTYTLTVEADGFRRSVHTGVLLTTGEVVRVDAALELGAVSEEITVTGAAVQVDSTTAVTSTLIDGDRIQDLPLNGRNLMQLARLIPTVQAVWAREDYGWGARSGPSMSAAGGRQNMNTFRFNGGYFNQGSRNTGLNPPSPDSMQEFQIKISNFDAEDGRNPGAQVNMVTKSGTNQIHGSVWNYLRNNVMNSRGFFNTDVPNQRKNQFGFSLGGPVVKDKVFFFASAEGLRNRQDSTSSTAFLPSNLERSGDFTGLVDSQNNPITLVNPDDHFGDPMEASPGVDCIINNIVNPACMSPAAQNLLAFVPTATSPLTRLVTNTYAPIGMDHFTSRGDVNLSDKHSVSLFYFKSRNRRTFPNANGNIPGYISREDATRVHHFGVNDTYTINPQMVNEISFAFNRSISANKNTNDVTPQSVGVNMPPYGPNGGLLVTTGGRFTMGATWPQDLVNNNWQFRDSLSYITGRHTFKMGGEILHLNNLDTQIARPTVSFTGDRTGDPIADMVMGAFTDLNVTVGGRRFDHDRTEKAFWFQDAFKVSPRLTLTLGLRYELIPMWGDKLGLSRTFEAGSQSTVIPDAPPGVLYPGDTKDGKVIPNNISGVDKNNLAPRFGFAYDVFGDGKTALRGSYGIYYETINSDASSSSFVPFGASVRAQVGILDDPFTSIGEVNPPEDLPNDTFGCATDAAYPFYACNSFPFFPLPLYSQFNETNSRTPYVQTWNLTVQRQLSQDTMLELAYIGKSGVKLPQWKQLTWASNNVVPAGPTNAGDPASDANVSQRATYLPDVWIAGLFISGQDFRNWYHGTYVKVTRRFSNGLTLMGSYTFAKSLDTASSPNMGGYIAIPERADLEKGLSSFHRKHSVVTSWLYDLPTPNFTSSVANKVVGGWRLGGIFEVKTGGPFTPRNRTNWIHDGTGAGNRAMRMPGNPEIAREHSSRDDMINNYLNVDAFIKPSDGALWTDQEGTYPNGGRNIAIGPGFFNIDLNIIKNIPVKEGMDVQFRTEVFNLINRPNFGNPQRTVRSANFGVIGGAGDPLEPGGARVIQFGLKVIW